MNEIIPMRQQSARSQATAIEQSRAIAEVQAMVVVAQKFPRDFARVQASMREACKQVGLAEVAFFKFPRAGQNVTGPSIHLATELARCWGNLDYGIKETNRDDANGVSEMQAWAWDLETNARASTSFLVPHIIDTRQGPKKLKEGRDIYENNANNGARRVREMIFRVLPAWFVEEAESICRTTLERGTSEKPIAQQVADILDAFVALGISRARIEAKLGTKIAGITPVDLANLRISYKSIKHKEITADEEFPSVNTAAAGVDAILQDADHHPAPAVSDSVVVSPPAEPATGVSPTAGATGAPADVTMTPVAWLDGVRTELAKAETLSDVAMIDAANVVKAGELGATTLRNYKTAVLQARTRVGGAG